MISPKQKKILAFPYTKYDVLICDGAIRTGKTMLMVIAFIDWAMREFNGQRFGICSKTVDSACKNIISPYLGLTYWKGKYSVKWRRTDKMLIVSHGDKENIFEVFGGRDESSFALIQGRTLAGVLIDEVALQPRSFVEQACARCSIDNSKIWFNCNPASPQHWFYTEWICQPEIHNAVRLHFMLEDNPSLSEQIIDRYKSMYTGIFYQRYILGEWVLAEGLVYQFGEENITDEQPKGAEYFISVDYGTLNAFSAGLWSVTGNKAVRIKEYYYSGRSEQVLKTDEEYADDIDQLAEGFNISKVVCDPSAASFITTLRRRGYAVLKANNDVLDGIRCTSTMLKNGNIKIHRSCVNTIREFGLYSWNDKSSVDSVIKENDHCLTGDTLVMIENGNVPIKNLVGKTGNVWSYNIHTQKPELKPFTDCRLTQKQAQIYEIKTADGGTIKCTAEHPILTKRGYVQAQHLTASDKIIKIEG